MTCVIDVSLSLSFLRLACEWGQINVPPLRDLRTLDLQRHGRAQHLEGVVRSRRVAVLMSHERGEDDVGGGGRELRVHDPEKDAPVIRSGRGARLSRKRKRCEHDVTSTRLHRSARHLL